MGKRIGILHIYAVVISRNIKHAYNIKIKTIFAVVSFTIYNISICIHHK